VSGVVVAAAVGFLGMGAYALAAPARVLAIFGVQVATVDGRNEVRAVYGGFGLAIGAILLAALTVPALREGILVTVAAALAGMAGGRLVAAAIDGSPGRIPWLFMVIEAVAGIALFMAAGPR
jgi:hypothetical protein